jgi:hypothetical protein
MGFFRFTGGRFGVDGGAAADIAPAGSTESGRIVGSGGGRRAETTAAGRGTSAITAGDEGPCAADSAILAVAGAPAGG